MRQSRWLPVFGITLAAALGVALAGSVVLPGPAAPPTRPRPGTAAPAIAEPPARARGMLHLVAAGRRGLRDGSFTGPPVSAYYGWVQAQAIIRGGRLADIRILRYPSDRITSRRIAERSLPWLEREVIRAQSARVHAVSGATLTSRAFLRSMDVALRQAAR